MIKVIKSFFIQPLKLAALSLILGMLAAHPAAASTSSIIINAENGEILSSSNPDTLRYPASLTKVMTLYIAFDALNKGLIKMSDELPVSRHAANMSPSRLGLRPGQKIKVETCIKALVIKSANDCAAVLAEGLGYTEENFAKTMTKVARELGMKNTTFKNASGLPNKAQKTTARDMALLGAAMYHHFPEYYKLFSMKSFTYNGQKIYTHNHLLKTFKGADGMKTGFTNAAGYNIITSAQRDGQRVIAVTMGHNTLRLRDTTVAKMMEKGLKKLAMDEKVKASGMYASLDSKSINIPDSREQTAQNKKKSWKLNEQNSPAASKAETSETTIASADNAPATDIWGIQVGAFSNYAKARSYALKIKKEVFRKSADKPINIEPVASGSAIIYRSKIIGFAKNDADAACTKLKKNNKSCIVVAVKSNDQLLLANNQY